MLSQRKGVGKKATNKSKNKLSCSVRKPKHQQQAVKKVDRLLAKAIAAENKKLRKKKAPRERQKHKNQKGKGIFSVLVPLIATAISSAVASR